MGFIAIVQWLPSCDPGFESSLSTTSKEQCEFGEKLVDTDCTCTLVHVFKRTKIYWANLVSQKHILKLLPIKTFPSDFFLSQISMYLGRYYLSNRNMPSRNSIRHPATKWPRRWSVSFNVKSDTIAGWKISIWKRGWQKTTTLYTKCAIIGWKI